MTYLSTKVSEITGKTLFWQNSHGGPIFTPERPISRQKRGGGYGGGGILHGKGPIPVSWRGIIRVFWKNEVEHKSLRKHGENTFLMRGILVFVIWMTLGVKVMDYLGR